MAEQLLITLTRHGPGDRLSRQERACAQAYAKQGVRDKAALAHLLSRPV